MQIVCPHPCWWLSSSLPFLVGGVCLSVSTHPSTLTMNGRWIFFQQFSATRFVPRHLLEFSGFVARRWLLDFVQHAFSLVAAVFLS